MPVLRGGGAGAQSQNAGSQSGSTSTANVDEIDAAAGDGAAQPTISALSGSALVNVLA